MTDMDKAIEEARRAVLPFESWERLPKESGAAYAAFCAYRDYGPDRNIRRALEAAERDEGKRGKRYGMFSDAAQAASLRGPPNSGGGIGRRTMTAILTV
jgi:hypothetical protein